MKPLWETTKFVARMLVIAAPFIIAYLTESGLVEEAATFSAVVAIADKYLHNSSIPVKGIIPF